MSGDRKIGVFKVPSDEERAANIRRLAEVGRRSAAEVAQANVGFLAARSAMQERIRAADELRSLMVRQQGIVLREAGVLPPDRLDASSGTSPEAA